MCQASDVPYVQSRLVVISLCTLFVCHLICNAIEYLFPSHVLNVRVGTLDRPKTAHHHLRPFHGVISGEAPCARRHTEVIVLEPNLKHEPYLAEVGWTDCPPHPAFIFSPWRNASAYAAKFQPTATHPLLLCDALSQLDRLSDSQKHPQRRRHRKVARPLPKPRSIPPCWTCSLGTRPGALEGTTPCSTLRPSPPLTS